MAGTCVIPYTPCVAHLFATLPRRNGFVFSSTVSAGGTLLIPRNPHNDACKVAGIDELTIYGLRRSFKSLTEWLEIPGKRLDRPGLAGFPANVQKLSGTDQAFPGKSPTHWH